MYVVNVTYPGTSSAWRASSPWISQKEPCFFVASGSSQWPAVMEVLRLVVKSPRVVASKPTRAAVTACVFVGDRAGRSPTNKDTLLALVSSYGRRDATVCLCVCVSALYWFKPDLSVLVIALILTSTCDDGAAVTYTFTQNTSMKFYEGSTPCGAHERHMTYNSYKQGHQPDTNTGNLMTSIRVLLLWIQPLNFVHFVNSWPSTSLVSVILLL